MKNFLIAVIIIIIIIVGWSALSKKNTDKEVLVPAQESIKGCYVAHLAKDVYTLKITSQELENFNGELSFKNFEKDSSRGSYIGTYHDGILLGEYSFNSEGMNSNMEVIFKKSGNTFIRGYGDVDSSGTHFLDPTKITYDPNQTFIVSAECPI